MRAFFITLIFAVNSWASGPTCEGVFADYRSWNPTAALAARDYTAPNARPYRDYAQVLKPAIPRGALVMDLGGGQGRAMSELAASTGVETIVVNTQDFTGRYPRVRYLTGWAEDVLARAPENSVDVILDFFGAFHYSARKDLIVEETYRALKPGGSAYILFDYQNSEAFVGRERFDHYLESVNPNVFSIRPAFLNRREVSILKITKPRTRRWFGFAQSVVPMKLGLEIERVDENPRLRLAVPRVRYRNSRE
jgi:SAM-dependent methyltransferase